MSCKNSKYRIKKNGSSPQFQSSKSLNWSPKAYFCPIKHPSLPNKIFRPLLIPFPPHTHTTENTRNSILPFPSSSRLRQKNPRKPIEITLSSYKCCSRFKSQKMVGAKKISQITSISFYPHRGLPKNHFAATITWKTIAANHGNIMKYGQSVCIIACRNIHMQCVCSKRKFTFRLSLSKVSASDASN